MASTIVTAFTVAILFTGAWIADLVCYHPQANSVDPLAPINIRVAWK